MEKVGKVGKVGTGFNYAARSNLRAAIEAWALACAAAMKPDPCAADTRLAALVALNRAAIELRRPAKTNRRGTLADAAARGPLAALEKGDPPPTRSWLRAHGYLPARPPGKHALVRLASRRGSVGRMQKAGPE